MTVSSPSWDCDLDLIYLSIYLSVSVCLPTYLPNLTRMLDLIVSFPDHCLSFYCTHPSTHPPIYLSIYLSIYLVIDRSIHPSIYWLHFIDLRPTVGISRIFVANLIALSLLESKHSAIEFDSFWEFIPIIWRTSREWEKSLICQLGTYKYNSLWLIRCLLQLVWRIPLVTTIALSVLTPLVSLYW